jgi:hypothetical protein
MSQSKLRQDDVVWGGGCRISRLTHLFVLALQYAFSVQNATLERTAQRLRRHIAQRESFHLALGGLLCTSMNIIHLIWSIHFHILLLYSQNSGSNIEPYLHNASYCHRYFVHASNGCAITTGTE